MPADQQSQQQQAPSVLQNQQPSGANATTLTCGAEVSSTAPVLQGIKLTPQNTVSQTNPSGQVAFRPTQIAGRQPALSVQPSSHSGYQFIF